MNEDYRGLNLVELLNLLEPVPEPEPISMWPETVGWLVVAVLLLVVTVFGMRTALRRHRANAYRREALAALSKPAIDVSEIAAILRRTALAGFRRKDVAGRYGEDWLSFLDQSYPGSGFANGPGRILVEAPYRGDSMEAPDDLRKLAAEWIQRHAPPEGALR